MHGDENKNLGNDGTQAVDENQAAAILADAQAAAAAILADAQAAADELLLQTENSASSILADAETEATKIVDDAKAAINSGNLQPSVSLSKFVTVGCKLPNGIVLEHPLDPNQKVQLNGVNQSLIKEAGYGITQVDRDFFDSWLLVNSKFPAYKNGTIFYSKSKYDIDAVGGERSKVRTGFEKMPQEAMGVKKAEKD